MKNTLDYINKVVEDAIRIQGNFGVEEIQDDQFLVDDLGFDSIDFVEVVLNIEESFKLDLLGDEFDECQTVGDFKKTTFSLCKDESM